MSEIGIREAGRKYGLPSATISNWVRLGEVDVHLWASKPSKKTLLDEDSLLQRLKHYRPHRDSQAQGGSTSTVGRAGWRVRGGKPPNVKHATCTPVLFCPSCGYPL